MGFEPLCLLPLACWRRGWRGQARPLILLQGSPTQDAPFNSRILSRKFSLVTRVSLMRLARFPWPRKDDTHRSVTGFFSVADANRLARQAACSVYVEGFYGWREAGYSSVGRASDCRACRDQMVPGSIPGGRICLTPDVDQKLAYALRCNEY